MSRPIRLPPLALASLALVISCTRRPIESTPAVSSATTSATRVRALLTALAHDSMEGRRLGTPGEARAARYIAERMREMGLTPAGDSGFFQRLPLAITTRRAGRAGQERVITGPALLPSLADLDSVPRERRLASANVIGLIRGTDPAVAGEIVVVGAHLDHLGIGRPVNGDSIFNGADDDASGVVAVLEAARMMVAGPKPRRTMVFVAFTGEEQGGFGVRWYTDHPVALLDRHVAELQVEMIGRPDSMSGGAGRAGLTGFERSTMGESFVRAGLPVIADPYPSQQFFLRSDNIVLARRGVVAQTISSFGVHRDYHQPSDEVRFIDFDHMTTLVDVIGRAVRLLADGPKPEWKPGGRP